MNVYEYFEQELQAPPDPLSDPDSLKELSIDDPCGLDCKKVIDAAKKLLEVSDPAAHDEIRNAALAAVLISELREYLRRKRSCVHPSQKKLQFS